MIKSSPIDFKAFRSETSVKYPTFSPGRASDASTEKVATALAPIPVRSHYHHNMGDDDNMSNMIHNHPPRHQAPIPQQLPPTPAPSPPPNGKAKKQYQTDPNRPFLFPFSRSRGSSQKLVPFAIDEADRLYMRHMHISLALYQMWQTREAYILDESGIDPYSPEGQLALERKAASVFGSSASKTTKISPPPPPANDSDDPPEAALPDVRRLDAAITEAQVTLSKAEAEGDRALKRKAKERRDDLVRLRRVETLYVSHEFGLLYTDNQFPP